MILAQTPSLSSSFEVVPPPVDISPLAVRDPRRKGKHQRRVAFFPEVSIQYIIHHNDYTATERQQTWLTQSELKSIKRKGQKLALDLSSSNSDANNHNSNTKNDDDDRCCLRGLEGRTRKGLARRKRIKKAARDAVLWEQGLQRKWGVYGTSSSDAETSLADAYYEFTECAQVAAHMVGLRDATTAAAIALEQQQRSSSDEPTTTTTTTTTTVASSSSPRAHPINSRRTDNDTTTKTIDNTRRPDPPGKPARITSAGRTSSSSSSSTARSLQSLSHLTSTRRLLTGAFFQV